MAGKTKRAPKRITVYIETSVVSYYCGRPSRDLVTAAHQQLTAEWWETRLPVCFRPYVSEAVRIEAAAGDPDAAEKRLAAIQGFERLEFNVAVARLAKVYLRLLRLPEDALPDATHIAYAVHYRLDCLATWNCRHIASRRARDDVARYNLTHGLTVPELCTPEELMEETDE